MKPQYNIVDARTLPLLISKINQYEVKELGALVVHNTHYYQSFMGVLKDTLVVPEVTLKKELPLAANTSKDPNGKPKVTRKSRAKPKDT